MIGRTRPLYKEELAELDDLLDRHDRLSAKEQKRLDFLRKQNERTLRPSRFNVWPDLVLKKKR
jgi:hypothetical protein